MSGEDAQWNISASYEGLHCLNPIREIVDSDLFTPNPEKEVLRLNIGDPTFFGNLPASPVAREAVAEVVRSGAHDNYKKTIGGDEARRAVAKTYSYPDSSVTEKDVLITSGCAQAIEFCLTALCDPGTNFLFPRPGFSIYQVNADSRQVNINYYDLQPDKGWEADLVQMDSLVNDKTRALVVVNPSNPCGSVYSREHLQAIAKVAEKHRLPIIVDEIYENVVYHGAVFHPMASVVTSVPILCCSGVAKRHLIPGWRTGWVIVYDQQNRLAEVRKALAMLSMRILGPNSLVQGALPAILDKTPQEFFDKTTQHLAATSTLAYDSLATVPCLKPLKTYGAMYMLFGVDFDQLEGINDDMEFASRLMNEESVFLLPGRIFAAPRFVRVVLLSPVEIMKEAMERTVAFCHRHMKKSS